MRDYATIREFKTRNFTVRVTAEEEPEIDLSWDDDGSVQRGLDTGKYICFCAKAAAYYRGNEIATDYLGQCIYESPKAFMDHRGIKHFTPVPGVVPEGGCGSYFSDMVRTVIAEARKQLAEFKQVHIRAIA